MPISAIYIIQRFFYRILQFIYHWYVESFILYASWFLGVLERFDRGFALKVTVRSWLSPMYQDYTLVGYIMGVTFRTLRIFLALVFYLILTAIALAGFLAWALAPIYAVYQILFNLKLIKL
ncbi:MAG: hypothetical protein PHP03_03030 [Candidatus Pacebacteria bacterium]|nr:hypothetical protein [Candidatus Paceibacterota bacterium]